MGNKAIVFDLDSRGAALVILACASNCSRARDVWVDALKLSIAALPVLEGLPRPSTVAAVIQRRAVNELLLREREQFASSDLVNALESTSC